MSTFTPTNEGDSACRCGIDRRHHGGPLLTCPPRMPRAEFEAALKEMRPGIYFAECGCDRIVLPPGLPIASSGSHCAFHAAFDERPGTYSVHPSPLLLQTAPPHVLEEETCPACGGPCEFPPKGAVAVSEVSPELKVVDGGLTSEQVAQAARRYFAASELVAAGEFAVPESQLLAELAPAGQDLAEFADCRMLYLDADNLSVCLHCAKKRGVEPGQAGTEPVYRDDDWVREDGRCFDCGESPYFPEED